jgi:hypothetical protein
LTNLDTNGEEEEEEKGNKVEEKKRSDLLPKPAPPLGCYSPSAATLANLQQQQQRTQLLLPRCLHQLDPTLPPHQVVVTNNTMPHRVHHVVNKK